MTVPPGDEDQDQDTMAAEWEAQMDGEGEEGDDQDDLAAEWEAMVGGVVSSVSDRKTIRVLNQDEIDSLLGFDKEAGDVFDKSGIQAILNSAIVSYERLPMLEAGFDRLVRMMSTSLRNFTSDKYAGWIGGLSPA